MELTLGLGRYRRGLNHRGYIHMRQNDQSKRFVDAKTAKRIVSDTSEQICGNASLNTEDNVADNKVRTRGTGISFAMFNVLVVSNCQNAI